jgi:hypothetical protein
LPHVFRRQVAAIPVGHVLEVVTLGLEFDSLETSVRGHWDGRGQGEWERIEPAFKGFVVERHECCDHKLNERRGKIQHKDHDLT